MISIIIPFYHGNKYMKNMMTVLEKNSMLLKEKTGESAEVVIVNDSPQEEPAINTDSYSMPVRVTTNEKNQGIHKSRVRGLEQAEGEYIIFLDQDDLISEDCVLSQYQKIGGHDFVVANGFLQKNENGDGRDIYPNERIQSMCLNEKTYYRYDNLIASPGQVMIKKDAIPDEWKNHMILHNGSDDYYLWILLLESGALGVINRDKVYTHVYTGENTGLDTDKLMTSADEVVRQMEHRTSVRNLRAARRRIKYYKNYRPDLAYKIRYIDVGLNRWWYYKRYL